jgi:hypothetical protein
MFSQLNEIHARDRIAELSRASNQRRKSRGALRIMLDARRMRELNPDK